MDWLTADQVVIDCDQKQVTAYTSEGIYFKFQVEKYNALPQAVDDSHWHGQLMGWLASLTLEDRARHELGLL